MRLPNWLILFVLLVSLLSPLGIAGGFSAGGAWNNGAFTRWQRLPDPPARPVKIAGGTTAAVFIEAQDGQVYSCHPLDGQCWAQAEEPVSLSPKNKACEQYPIQYSVSAPPGEVSDYLQTQWCHFEAGEEVDYALLADGSLWRWNHRDASFLNLARAFGAMGGGCCGGLLISLAAAGFIWLRGRRKLGATASQKPE